MQKPLITRLGYVAIEAVDPEAVAIDTAETVGAQIVERSAGRILMSGNDRHAEFIVVPGQQNRMLACGLEAPDAASVDLVERRCVEAGLRIVTRAPSLDCIERAVTFATSEGHQFEVHTPMPKNRTLRSAGPGVPKCIDHVNFTLVDPAAWADEMSAACGLLVSQRTTGHEITWMRGSDRRHHTVAAVKSAAPGVHHISWEFNAFDDLKQLSDGLAAQDRPLVWGPGRHGAGDNLFLYFKNPAGFLIECIAEMEVINDDAMEPRVVDPGKNLSNWKVVNKWGALPPMEWIEHNTPIAPPPHSGAGAGPTS